MSARFWLKRLLMALVVSSAILFLVQLIKGDTPGDAVQFAAFWGALSAALFTLVGYIRYRRSPGCMLPREQKQ